LTEEILKQNITARKKFEANPSLYLDWNQSPWSTGIKSKMSFKRERKSQCTPGRGTSSIQMGDLNRYR